MAQVLLQNNRRASWILLLLSGLPILLGIALYAWRGEDNTISSLLLILAIVLTIAGVILCFRQIAWLRKPRISCTSNELLVYLKGFSPFRIPLDVVEVFFLGEGPSMVPALNRQEVPSVTVVIRLAEKATEWHRRDTSKSLGHWCDGYIIVRGTWTEPLNKDVVGNMNSQLAAIKRARKNPST